jgi:predicted enzyme related to lactoylglutathione lyase
VSGTPFWTVDDINGEVKALVEASGTVSEDVHQVGGGKQVAIVEDAQGNAIGLSRV